MPARKIDSPAGSLDALASEEKPWASLLTRAGFAIAVAVTIARLLMLEVTRESVDVASGISAAPRGPGAASGLVLDMISCVPALLALIRASIDPAFKVRRSYAFLFTAAVAVWIGASVFWADDKFLSAVNAAHWIAALALLWATAQIVRSWALARIVAGVAVGILFCLTAQGLIYRFVDVPDMRRDWEEHKAQILKEHNWDPDSFMARQFGNRVLNGNVQGFNSSPNTFAALLVTLGVISAGAAVQRLRDRDEWGWPIALIVVVPPATALVGFTGSKTGFATPLVAACIFAIGWRFREWFTRRRRIAFACGISLVVFIIIAIVGHGLYHGTLPTDSLAFRWRYWIGSARLFATHPLLGVGWGNFGANYLAFRLPAAAEEIKDPHNIVVRFATELGAVGLLLFLGWMLSLAWSITRPVTLAGDLSDGNPHAPTSFIGSIVGLCSAGILLNVICSIDFEQNAAWITIELLRRLLFLALLIVGTVLVSLRSSKHQVIDERAAPLLLHAFIAALAAFMLHNLVDVPMSEPGVMALFGLLAGTVLGLRGTERTLGRKMAITVGIVTSLVWFAGIFAAGSIVAAENAANEGDKAFRAGDPARAARSYSSAFQTAFIPNADYAYRGARALLFARAEPSAARAAIDLAVATDPTALIYRRTRAMMALDAPAPDVRAVRADFDAFLKLNPNDVQSRLDYADILERLGDRDTAVNELREALRFDDLLDAAEPKRLTPSRVDEIRSRIAKLAER